MRASAPLLTPILIACCLMVMISFGIRAAFGVFQIPIAEEFGWLRADFSLAIAIQNLAWGIGQPIFSALAERFGTRRALVAGALTYAAGLFFSAWAITPGQHQWLEVLVGFGIAGTGFGVILAVVGRTAAPERRAMAMAIATAAGSVGQIVVPPLTEGLLQWMSWQNVFILFAVAMILSLSLLPFIRDAESEAVAAGGSGMADSMRRAFRDPSYSLLALGFFSCGYQLGFVTAHFPAFVTEVCGPINPASVLASIGVTTTSALGALSIAVIGAANIGGTLLAGWLAGRFPKKYLLASLYTLRMMFCIAFIVTPMTPATVLLFAAFFGATWLATVPLTSGLVGQIYGLRYMGTLYAFIFLSHQVGSFLGVWLGGELYDATGSYELVWWIGVGVSAFSALVHLPVQERPIDARAAA